MNQPAGASPNLCQWYSCWSSAFRVIRAIRGSPSSLAAPEHPDNAFARLRTPANSYERRKDIPSFLPDSSAGPLRPLRVCGASNFRTKTEFLQNRTPHFQQLATPKTGQLSEIALPFTHLPFSIPGNLEP